MRNETKAAISKEIGRWLKLKRLAYERSTGEILLCFEIEKYEKGEWVILASKFVDLMYLYKVDGIEVFDFLIYLKRFSEKLLLEEQMKDKPLKE